MHYPLSSGGISGGADPTYNTRATSFISGRREKVVALSTFPKSFLGSTFSVSSGSVSRLAFTKASSVQEIASRGPSRLLEDILITTLNDQGYVCSSYYDSGKCTTCTHCFTLGIYKSSRNNQSGTSQTCDVYCASSL
jgi:hypothetical protein